MNTKDFNSPYKQEQLALFNSQKEIVDRFMHLQKIALLEIHNMYDLWDEYSSLGQEIKKFLPKQPKKRKLDLILEITPIYDSFLTKICDTFILSECQEYRFDEKLAEVFQKTFVIDKIYEMAERAKIEVENLYIDIKYSNVIFAKILRDFELINFNFIEIKRKNNFIKQIEEADEIERRKIFDKNLTEMKLYLSYSKFTSVVTQFFNHFISLNNFEKTKIKKTSHAQIKEIKDSIPRPEQILTREQTAYLLQVDLSTLWSWTKKGKLKAYGIGNRVYYKRSEVENSLIPIGSNHNKEIENSKSAMGLTLIEDWLEVNGSFLDTRLYGILKEFNGRLKGYRATEVLFIESISKDEFMKRKQAGEGSWKLFLNALGKESI